MKKVRDYFGTFLDTVRGNNVGTINIAGQSFQGNDLSIVGGRIIIDGVDVTDQTDAPKAFLEVRITEGDVGIIRTDKAVNVLKGSVRGNIDAGGAVNCNNVYGSVSAQGAVNADNITGDVQAGGSVNCDDIGGNVHAGGSVRADQIMGKQV